ncbi:MAG: hypothetical protein QM622_08295 [Microbacterium sp.]
MATETYAGPVDYLVFAFPSGAAIAPGLREILARVDAGHIEILDLELVSRGADGAPATLALTDLPDDAAATLAAIVAELSDGQFAVAIVYEDRSLAAAAAESWTAAGGIEIFSGGIDIADLEEQLEEEN